MDRSSATTDFLVIGGGVIGLNLALQAKRRHPQSHVTLIEKEQDCGSHASGRNSGVLHAGFYYTADSLKARFTREGNRLLTDYCAARGLRINRCGKLVVARDETELAGLQELFRRGKANGVELYELSEREAREIEPRVKTFRQALFSPTTSSVDPAQVLAALTRDAVSAGVKILTRTSYLRHRDAGAATAVTTSAGCITAGYVINAAGLYADKIAARFGFSRDYRILPFKGLYLYARPGTEPLRTHIYPVPNLDNPFLGVHYTLTVDGHVKIGPTAIPAFWREHYAGLKNFKFLEMTQIVGRELLMLLRNDFRFRSLALAELQKYSKKKMVQQASDLISGVDVRNYASWGKPGIRAQLFDLRQRRLEMDFRFEGDHRSFHVLNAVSPAFTCSIPFAEFLFDQIENKVKGRAGGEVLGARSVSVKA